MNNIHVRNVNEALVEGLWHLKANGVIEESRNGPVVVMPGPFCTTYARPTERILWHPGRDANPVFHLMEAVWMLAGANDVNWLLPFNSTFGRYAEDDGTMHGAYGHRWRVFHGFDQLHAIVDELRANPNSRRAVLGMWNPATDLAQYKRDLPCNTHIYFDLRGGHLNMTVCCRSNDAVMGAYGANVVHMSMLQELLAHALGAPVGVYRQISNNFHLYLDGGKSQKLYESIETAPGPDPYVLGDVHPTPLLQPNEDWRMLLADCENIVSFGLEFGSRTVFMQDVVKPLYTAYLDRKADKPYSISLDTDWGCAFQRWVDRRNGGAA